MHYLLDGWGHRTGRHLPSKLDNTFMICPTLSPWFIIYNKPVRCYLWKHFFSDAVSLSKAEYNFSIAVIVLTHYFTFNNLKVKITRY